RRAIPTPMRARLLPSTSLDGPSTAGVGFRQPRGDGRFVPVIWTVEPDLVRLTIVGTPSVEDLPAAGADAIACPRFRPGLPLVVDARAALVAIAVDAPARGLSWLGWLLEQGLAPRCAMVTTVERLNLLRGAVTPPADHGLMLAHFTHL